MVNIPPALDMEWIGDEPNIGVHDDGDAHHGIEFLCGCASFGFLARSKDMARKRYFLAEDERMHLNACSPKSKNQQHDDDDHGHRHRRDHWILALFALM